jgi:effector-binding domain-containing protein
VIVTLREMDFSLDEIREIFTDCEEDGDLLAHLELKRASLEKRLGRLQSIVPQIDAIIRTEFAMREISPRSSTSFEIEEKELEPLTVAGIRRKCSYSDMGFAFAVLSKRVGRYIAGNPLCLYYDGEFRETDADIEACIPVPKNFESDDVLVRELPAVYAVTLIHRGPYEELGRSYERLFKYVRDRGYAIELPSREVYLKGPGMIFRGNPKKYLTEIQLPIGDSK